MIRFNIIDEDDLQMDGLGEVDAPFEAMDVPLELLSFERNGSASTLLNPVAGTRYFDRITFISCPRLISGTRTCLNRYKTSPRFFGKGFK